MSTPNQSSAPAKWHSTQNKGISHMTDSFGHLQSIYKSDARNHGMRNQVSAARSCDIAQNGTNNLQHTPGNDIILTPKPVRTEVKIMFCVVFSSGM